MDEYQELLEINNTIESETFQKYIMKPMKDYRYAQKNNFFSDSLKDQWRKGGRVEAINEFLKILKELNTQLKNKRFDIENTPGK